jgi:hypothetical protein
MTKTHVPVKLKRLVTARARDCCEYCRSQSRFAPQPFSIEHIVPRQAGGPTTESNLALSCQGCNNHKATKTMAIDPVTEQSAFLFNPRTQHWREHFTWSEGYTLMLGLTPAGRATVNVLRLNRKGLVNLRRVLYAMGEHPPMEPAEVGL